MSRKPYRPPFPTSRELMLKPGFHRPGGSTTPANRSIPPVSRRQPTTDAPSSSTATQPQPSTVWPDDYKVVSTFMFTKECLESTPSLRYHGITPEEEMQLRLIGTVWIKELYLRINVRYKNLQNAPRISVRASCVAMIYFHRFYMYHSFGIFDPTHIATAALFLATKCEECPNFVKHFIGPLYNVSFPHDTDPLEPEDRKILEDLITSMETHILQTLAFELQPKLCHLVVIETPLFNQKDMKQELKDLSGKLQLAGWKICIDIYQYTTLCLRYTEKTLAAAAIFAASSYIGVKLNTAYGNDWLEKVDPDTDFATVVAITVELTKSYEKYSDLFPRLPNARNPASDVVSDALQAEEFRCATNAAANNSDRNDESSMSRQSRFDAPSSSQSRQHSVSQSRERHHSSRSEKEGKSDRHSHSRHDSIGDRQPKDRHREHKSDRHQRESNGAGDYRHHSGPAPAYHPGNLNVREKADSLQQFALNTRQQHHEDKEEGEIE
uniref:CYCLIN domain-containing protein n=1 Tax=Panagrellus redivivus TaxID=6233 RepID=A0A7E4V1E2_PANRE